MLKFSKANNKLKNLANVKAIAKYLQNKRKVYSLDLLSGWSCPFANECLSKVVELNGKRKIKDGPNTQFRCFSASQEALYPAVYNLRKHNLDYLRNLYNREARSVKSDKGRLHLSHIISKQLPSNTGVLRMHVGGDFFNQTDFDVWALVARQHPDILFYAYTKSLPYWINRLEQLTDNFVLTASRGGRMDHLIDEHNLRSTVVIADEILCEKIWKQKQHDRINKHKGFEQFRGLPIDHDDSHAANPDTRHNDFALLIHGGQPAGSEAGRAKGKLKGVGSYGTKS